MVAEGAPHVLLLDAVDLRGLPDLVPQRDGGYPNPNPGPTGTSAADEDSDGDEADGGWVLVGPGAVVPAGRGGKGWDVGDGPRGLMAGGPRGAPVRLLPDPAAAERLWAVAGGAAWALTLRWLPALATLLADGALPCGQTLHDMQPKCWATQRRLRLPCPRIPEAGPTPVAQQAPRL